VLWGYFDYSKDEVSKRCITLAGIVSSEAIWPEFEKKWVEVLRLYGVSAFHAADAFAREEEFVGWTDEQVMQCVWALYRVIGEAAGRQFVIKACTVKLDDYRKAKAGIPTLREEQALCVDYCCGTALPDPDEHERPGGAHSRVIFYFDQNERFRHYIKRVWDKERKSRSGWTTQVKDILEVSAQGIPALQAADVIAWIINGYYKGDTRAKALFSSVKVLSLNYALFRYYDYEQIQRQYGNRLSEPPQ
jgi:hypothetical protein